METVTRLLSRLLLLLFSAGLCFAAEAHQKKQAAAGAAAAGGASATKLRSALRASHGLTRAKLDHRCQHYQANRQYEGYFTSGGRQIKYTCSSRCACVNGVVSCGRESCNYRYYNPYYYDSRGNYWGSTAYNTYSRPQYKNFDHSFSYTYVPHYSQSGSSYYGGGHYDYDYDEHDHPSYNSHYSYPGSYESYYKPPSYDRFHTYDYRYDNGRGRVSGSRRQYSTGYSHRQYNPGPGPNDYSSNHAFSHSYGSSYQTYDSHSHSTR